MKPQTISAPRQTTLPLDQPSLDDLRSLIAPNATDPTRQEEAAFRQHNLGNWHIATEPTELPESRPGRSQDH